MGSLTDFFRYISEPPQSLKEIEKTMYHVEPTEKLKKARRIVKLWTENNETD